MSAAKDSGRMPERDHDPERFAHSGSRPGKGLIFSDDHARPYAGHRFPARHEEICRAKEDW